MSSAARDRLTVDAIGARRLSRMAATAHIDELAAAGTRDDYTGWLSHVAPAAGCTHPVKLSGTVYRVETSTGRITS